MMDIVAIQNAVREHTVFFTDHAVRQMAKRNIDDIEVCEVILAGEIIEEILKINTAQVVLCMGKH